MKETYGWSVNFNDSQKYIDICEQILQNDEVFSNFKCNGEYNNILEHVGFELGQEYFSHIKKVGEKIYNEYYEKFIENDIIGNPKKYFYDNKEISPTTLRYIKNTFDLSSICEQEKICKIVEVGGGYGGLCKTLSVLCNFNQYISVDLPETIEVQKKYLKNFFELYSKIKFISCNQLNDIFDVDIFISNYCLSELDLNSQLNYYNKVIKNSKIVYITYNFMVENCENNYNTIISKLKEDGFEVNTDNYYDYGCSTNKIIVAKK